MNASARFAVDSSISTWPLKLPYPQTPTIQINWNKPTDDVGTLLGPSRFRLTNINTSPSYEFEILFTADECETFEAWYNDVVALGGEVYLPWIGEGRILYLSEYELSPLGTGWKLHALAVQLYIDKDFIDRHVCDVAYAWRMLVIVDADAQYSVITCDLPGNFLRPRVIDSFFSDTDPIAHLIDPLDTPATVIADLTAINWWVGNVWQNGQPGEFAELTDTITASLQATSLNYPIFINIPENWMWDDNIDTWYAQARMVYIDDWETIWEQELVNACRLLKDTLPPPWPIVNGNDMLNFAWMERIIADDFPLETYVYTPIEFPLPTLIFTVAPTTVMPGDSAVLTWATENAYRVVASGGWSGNQARFGTANTGPLWQTTPFTLSATGPGGGPITQTVTVNMIIPPPPPRPTVSITATPMSVVTGGSSVLTWTTTDAETVTASDGWSGSLATSGATGRTLTTTTTFTIIARNSGGSAQASVTVEATAPPPPPPPLFSSQLIVVARPGGAPGQYGFFFGGPTTGGAGSVSPANLPAGGSALGLRIQSISSAPGVVGGVDLYLMTDGADSRLTQTNQFDSVTVVDDSGVTRTFTTAPQPALTFGNGGQYGRASWVWSGDNQVMRTAKTYTFTFRKAT